MSIELIPLFSVPVIKFKFSKHSKYNFPTIKKRERIPDGWEVSLNTSYPCTKDDDPYIFPETRDCMDRDLLSDVLKVLKRLGLSYKGAYFTDSWYNVYHDKSERVNLTSVNYSINPTSGLLIHHCLYKGKDFGLINSTLNYTVNFYPFHFSKTNLTLYLLT